ncbi:Uu.00g108380.m01.CDS01 [Anthostomella pinea]|uniref:Uu.00g108380.m01.CDS01 n=1 Tax=Anthostomella pinea TaxID=933095 RepID=A0AAI8VF73_9PEZI|nr:Uu.00g108380.m01.CDS01 [Anthostomella pinea]
MFTSPPPIPREEDHFSAKRFCLQALLWSGLLFAPGRCDGGNEASIEGAHNELLVIGTPVAHLSTITITTTIAYKPTLIPGAAAYSLLGCYGQPDDTGGHVFGADEHYACPDTVPAAKLTIQACLEGCSSLPVPSNGSEHYTYAGLRNGSECICGLQLLPQVHMLADDDCKTPCAGDARLSCGGEDILAIYGPASAASGANGGDGSDGADSPDSPDSPDGGNGDIGAKGPDSANASNAANGASSREGGSGSDDSEGGAASASKTGDQQDDSAKSGERTAESTANPTSNKIQSTTPTTTPATTTPSPKPTTTNNNAKAALPDLPTTTPPGTPPAPASAATIGAITGSMSGAVILAACLTLCFRAYRRKKRRQDLHVKVILDKKNGRPVPSPISTTFRKHHDADGRDSRDLRVTADGDLVPTTPALESGGRYVGAGAAGGLHARMPASAGVVERDSLYSTLMGEVRTGPVGSGVAAAAFAPSSAMAAGAAAADAAAASGVQWRSLPPTPNHANYNPSPTQTHSRTHSRKVSSHMRSQGYAFATANNTNANGSAGANVGTRTYGPVSPPASAARVEGLGDRAWHRRKISTPYQPQAQAQGGVPVSNTGNMAARGPPSGPPRMPLPPVRPRRSFDTIQFDDVQIGAPHTGHRRSRSSMGFEPPLPLNIRKNPPPQQPQQQEPQIREVMLARQVRQDAVDDSPLLGQDGWGRLPPTRFGGGGNNEGSRGDRGLDGREPTVPVLPPIVPGENFDSRRVWRGTIYAESDGSSLRSSHQDSHPEGHHPDGGGPGSALHMGRDGDRDRDGHGGDRPSSGWSVGTSILFPLDDEDIH